MLNLSDIRKKAGSKVKKNKRSEGDPAEESDRALSTRATPVAPSSAGTQTGQQGEENASSGTNPEEKGISPPETSSSTSESSGQASGKRPESAGFSMQGTTDPLESLFRANPELGLATEEAYFEGLVGQDHETEEAFRQLLSFALGEEEYAVDIQDVQEIIKLREMTDVPRVPDFVLGIISLRGNIIPVFDLKRRLHLGTIEPTISTRIVVCRAGGKSVGLVVDKINQVVRLPEGAIEKVSGLLSGVNKDLVEGVGRYEGRMLILLDLSIVLAVEQR
ncbi:MAG: chemotaxis protein CheW [Desulfuromonadales bacterium]